MKEKELPEGWEWKRLGDVADVFNGITPSKSEQRENGHPVLKIKDIDDMGQFKNNQKSFVDNAFFLENQKKILKNGDTLILNAAHNREYVSSKKCYISNFPENILATGEWMIIRENSCLIDSKFIFFLLTSASISMKIKNIVKGIHLYPKDMANLTIPLPPISIQRQIVTVLEQAAALKRQRQEADALTGALLQSVFYGMFGDPVKNEKGWKVMALEELSSHIIDCPHSTPEYEDGITHYPCIRTTELKDGYIDWTQMKYLNEKNYLERINRLTPSEGDIVFGREGSFGVAVRVPKNVKLCLGQRVMLFRPDPKYCNSEFLWALLNSDAILRQANSKTSGSTVAHINVTDIKKFGGICPPLALQQQFARIVEEVERVRERQAESGKEIEALCGGLMQRAFGGELAV